MESQFVIEEDCTFKAYLSTTPNTKGVTIVQSKATSNASSVFDLDKKIFIELMLKAKKIAKFLCERLEVQRCALITSEVIPLGINIVPLHGVNSEWRPIHSKNPEFHEEYRGFIDSKNGPRASDEYMDKMKEKMKTEQALNSFEFFGDKDDTNLFAKIVRGEEKQWRIYEDSGSVAFLTLFPNVPGFSVIVPRKHLSSDIFSLCEEDYTKLLETAYTLANHIKPRLAAKEICLIFEGFEINYAHVKLSPIPKRQNAPDLQFPVYFDKYPGYITTQQGPKCSQDDLKALLKKLKNE